MFFNMKYKNVGKPTRQTIIQANSKEDAIKTVNNPKEIGLSAEVKEIKSAKKIAKGWSVSVNNNNGFPLTGVATKEIVLDDESALVNLIVGGKKKIAVKVKDIIGASAPGKDKRVMSRGY